MILYKYIEHLTLPSINGNSSCDRLGMISSSNDTFIPYKSKVECEVVGSRPAECMCNLPITKNDLWAPRCIVNKACGQLLFEGNMILGDIFFLVELNPDFWFLIFFNVFRRHILSWLMLS